MNISQEDVKYIAKLAKLHFTDEELLRLSLELEDILTHFRSLDRMDLSSTDLNEFTEGQISVVREDCNFNFPDKKKLFRNVKSMNGDYVQVPKII